MIYLPNPTVAQVHEINDISLGGNLEYIDEKVDFEIRRLSKARPWQIEYLGGFDAWKVKLASLKTTRRKSLLKEVDGKKVTHSGLASWLGNLYGHDLHVGYGLPESTLLPYSHVPTHDPRKYQSDAFSSILTHVNRGPVAIEVGTGLGKLMILRMLAKHWGLKTVLATPSKSIAGQAYDDFVYHFGAKYVGMYGNGKKQYQKRFVIAIDDSLVKVEPNTPAWDELSKADVYLVDEAHCFAAKTLAQVCFGLMAKAPYRVFVSGTQTRNDGTEKLLQGITGPIVYSMTVSQGVEQGYLAKPHFKMARVRSNSSYKTSEVADMTRRHLYYNPIVNKVAGTLASNFVNVMKRPTLILVKEVEQFSKLLPYLPIGSQFAHGPLTKENRVYVPSDYHDSDPKKLVGLFNEGKIPVLVGTSCIATGTDLKVPEASIYLMGGKSEIEVKQGAIGRCTRGGFNGLVNNPWTGKQKVDCICVDFDVENVPILHKHAVARKKFYEETNKVETIDMTGENV